MDAVEGWSFRVASIERRLARLEDLEPAVVRAQLIDVKDDIADLKREFSSIKRALYGLAISIAAGSLLFSFTAFQLWGGP